MIRIEIAITAHHVDSDTAIPAPYFAKSAIEQLMSHYVGEELEGLVRDCRGTTVLSEP